MFTKHNFPDNISLINIFFNTLDKVLDIYSNYKNVLLIGDFNAQIGQTRIHTFLYQYQLVNINKEPTCYKNSGNPSCIDFILSNRPKRFLKRILFLQDCQIFISQFNLFLKQHFQNQNLKK